MTRLKRMTWISGAAALALAAAAGAGLAIEALIVMASPAGSVASRAAHLAGGTRIPPAAVSVAVWPWFVVVAGLLALAAGAVAALFSRGWPSMGRRYESGPARAARAAAGETSMWDRLDHGDDPTI